MVLTAFQPALGLIRLPPKLSNSTLSNFVELFKFPVLRWTLNSLVVTAVQLGLGLLIPLLAAYGFALKPFPGSEIIFWILLASIMVPGEITLIPRFLIKKSLGLFNTLIAIIAPGLVGVVSIFLFRQYLKDFPKELLDMANIDGCGEIRKFSHLIVPLSSPMIAALIILKFPGIWKSFMWPMIVTSKTLVRTLPIGLYLEIAEEAETRTPEAFGITMAGAVYSFIPSLIVFLVFQKYFKRGLFSGSLKE